VVVTVPRGAIERFQSVGLDLTRVDLVEGGDTRAESVGKGLEFLRRSGVVVRPEEDLVAIHDAARPFFGTVEFHRLCERAADVGAAILAAPVVDAVCVVSERGVVKRYEPRDRLRAIQTPQVFRYELIMRAHTQNHSDTADAVDDGSLVLPFNQVEIVESSGENFKVTTPGDLERARGIFAALGERV
jgi:2-C-methyl-D-erythritol 4-phosphate cytidylyltransferase